MGKILLIALVLVTYILSAIALGNASNDTYRVDIVREYLEHPERFRVTKTYEIANGDTISIRYDVKYDGR